MFDSVGYVRARVAVTYGTLLPVYNPGRILFVNAEHQTGHGSIIHLKASARQY